MPPRPDLQAFQPVQNFVRQSRFFEANRPRIFKGIRKDVDLLVRLARAWATGKYKDVSVGSVLIVLGALLYLLDPFDVIPDFIPFLGLTDDATVIGLAISRLRHELNKYEDWENEITIK